MDSWRYREEGGLPPRHRGKEGKSFPLESGLAAGTELESSGTYAGRLSLASLLAVLEDGAHIHIAGIDDDGIMCGVSFID